MTINASTSFLVHNVRSTYAWLQVLHGDHEGTRISVPLYHDEYTDELRESIEKHLNANAIVNATVTKPGSDSNDWRLTELTPTAVTSV